MVRYQKENFIWKVSREGCQWQFNMMVSCGCPINENSCLLVGEGGLFEFDQFHGGYSWHRYEKKFETRSNDAEKIRGWIWFSTMGKEKESAGSIIVSMMGSLLSEQHFISPNSICFSENKLLIFRILSNKSSGHRGR